MNAKEAIEYIQSHIWSDKKLGLERTKELLVGLGNPQNRLKFVHVAGTNGKGSTCAMLASILQCAGYKTGLFTSPHISRFNERIKINGTDICDSTLSCLAEAVIPIADGMLDCPSQFELVTAIAMKYFADENCDIVVLEVGLGGTYDSTNIISSPECSIICNIGLEHTEYLGNTLSEIATAKAGIIKPGCSVVYYRGEPEVEAVFHSTAAALHSPIHPADFRSVSLLSRSLTGQSFSWKNMTNIHIPLLGKHQLRNAAVVLETVNVLREKGWKIDDRAIYNGLSSVSWPARFELMRYEPALIIDGAHNPQCAQALAETLGEFFPGKNTVFVIGVLSDKDYSSVLKHLRPLGAKFLCVTPPSSRALNGTELAKYLSSTGENAESCRNIREAIDKALASDLPVVICGSLYLAGESRNILADYFM